MTDPLVTALRQRREQLGLPAAHLAEQLGMYPTQLHQIERGNPTVKTLRAIAEALGCDIELVERTSA
jgi:transcriptional regulator with XRE-family HTH domain